MNSFFFLSHGGWVFHVFMLYYLQMNRAAAFESQTTLIFEFGCRRRYRKISMEILTTLGWYMQLCMYSSSNKSNAMCPKPQIWIYDEIHYFVVLAQSLFLSLVISTKQFQSIKFSVRNSDSMGYFFCVQLTNNCIFS